MKIAPVHIWIKINRVLKRLEHFFVLNSHLSESLKDSMVNSIISSMNASGGSKEEEFMTHINANIAAMQNKRDEVKKLDKIDWDNYYKMKDKSGI